MKLHPKIITPRYVKCPTGCDHEFRVEHMFEEHEGQEGGPWFCMECGVGWNVLVQDGELSMWPSKESYGDYRVIVLEIAPQSEPIRFKIIARDKLPMESDVAERECSRFYYEEHSCPTNWLGDVDTVYLGETVDPHGIAKLIEWRKPTPDELLAVEHGQNTYLDGSEGLNTQLERERLERLRQSN